MWDASGIVDAFALRNWSVRGDELTASCPFVENHAHGDRNPSFGINLTNGVYHCFSCGESGNVEQLAQKVLGLSRADAIMLAYGRLGGSVVSEHSERKHSVAKAELDADVDRWVGDPTGYWAGRGFTDESIGRFRLGYDPESRRVVVPITDHGVTVGWTKRRTDESVEPKWQHSYGLDRSEILFGLDSADGDVCILVEAPLSAIMLRQQGWGGAVASFGCSLSQGQADLIRGAFREVIIDYDPDDAGRSGASRAISMLSMFMPCKVVVDAVDDPAAQTTEQNSHSICSALPWWAAGVVYNNTKEERQSRKAGRWRSSRLGATGR